MSAVLAATSTGGAPVLDVALVGAGSALLAGLTLAAAVAHRRGGARPLRRLLDAAERLTRVPGWAAVPGLGAIACALVTIWGATWDIGLHIDVGRDEGPLGTAAHLPLLLGLLGMFLTGLLACGLAPEDPRRASPVALRVPGIGPVPAGAVLLSAASAFAMAGFPLDDLWHRIFGQDVTLWGPTHTMFIGGVLAAGVGAVLLLVEGARTAGLEPFRGRTLLHRPLPALMVGIFLFFWTATLHEFHWGVPQYRGIWQPMLLAFGGAHAMVLARLVAGRGGTLGALVVWLPMQAAMSLVIGGPLDTTMPAMPLFVAEAAVVEVLGARRDPRDLVRFGALAGLGVGTLGFAAEYAWSHVVMPVPWAATILPEAVPVAIAAGVAGGVLGALMAQALTGRLPAGRRRVVLPAAASAVALALGVNAAASESPAGVTAAITLANERTATPPGASSPTTVADVTVRLSRAGLGGDATWAHVLGWQGDGRTIAPLERGADGTLRTREPVPIGGRWKTLVRVHEGRTLLAAPVRMPPDPELGFAGFPAEPRATRTMTADTRLLQIERRDDGPLWAWTPALLLVLGLDLGLLVLMGAVCVRLGRLAPRRGAAPPTRVGRDVAPLLA